MTTKEELLEKVKSTVEKNFYYDTVDLDNFMSDIIPTIKAHTNAKLEELEREASVMLDDEYDKVMMGVQEIDGSSAYAHAIAIVRAAFKKVKE